MKKTLISIAAASVFALLLPSVQPAVAGGGAYRGESGVVELQPGKPVSELPPASDQLSPTQPPETPPEIITHIHPSILWVAGVPLSVPSGECGNIIEDALRQNREVYVADEYCRKIMRQALEIERNAPPVEAQQGIWREIPQPPPDVPAQPQAPAASVPNTSGLWKQIPNSR